MGSTCCNVRRTSLTSVVLIGTALSFLISSIIIVVLYVIRIVDLTEGEISQLKVEKLFLNFGSADSTVGAGGAQGTPLTGVENSPPQPNP